MEKIESIIKTIGAVVFTALSYLFGGLDKAIGILVLFMVLDYVSAIIKAFYNKTLNSEIGFKGLCKKAVIMIIIIVAVQLDYLISKDTHIFRQLTIFYFCSNEGLSILENCSYFIPIPEKIKTALEQLKEKDNE